MFKTQWLQQTLYYALCLLAFVIPLPFIFAAATILLITFLWLLQCNIRTTWYHLKTRKALWPWMIFFLLHVISYTYSHNKAQSLFNLQTKLSFLVLPVVIGAGMAVNKQLLERILKWFIGGISIVAVYCLIKATIVFEQTGNTQQFFYHKLVSGLDSNAVYQSWYTIFSISALLFFPWQKSWKMPKNIIIILQIFFLILLSSKTLLIIFSVFIIPYYIVHTANKRSSFIRAGAILCISVATLIFLFDTKNPIKKRYEEIITEPITLVHDTRPFHGSFNNLTIRLFLWQSGIENVKEHHLWWIGAGNGDAQDLQNKKYEERGIQNIFNAKDRSPLYDVNLHNMYLESLVMLGMPGLICLFFIIFTPFFYIKKMPPPYLHFIFYFISCIFLFQEAAFETQAGVVFYSFFSVLFWCHYYSMSQNHSKINNNKS